MPDLLDADRRETDLGRGKHIVVRRGDSVDRRSPARLGRGARRAGAECASATAVAGAADDPLTVVGRASPPRQRCSPRSRLTLLLAIGIPAGLLLTAGGSVVVIGRALRPLETAARQMEAIDATDLRCACRWRTRTTRSAAWSRRSTACSIASQCRSPSCSASPPTRRTSCARRSRCCAPASRWRWRASAPPPTTARLWRRRWRRRSGCAQLAEDLLTLVLLEAPPATPRRAAATRLRCCRSSPTHGGDAPRSRASTSSSMPTPTPASKCSAPPADLYRLFNNLIENALRHSRAAARSRCGAR